MRKVLLRYFAVFLVAVSPAVTRAQFQGAELRYTVGSDQTLNIELVTYYNCGYDPVPGFEYVALFETMAKSSQVYVKLDLHGQQEQINNISTPCKGMNACMNEVVYRGSTTLRPVPGGYDIVWSRCCLDGALSNVADDQEKGIVLTSSVSELAVREGNASPLFSMPPFVKACRGMESASLTRPVDSLGADSLVVVFTPIYSNVSTADPAINSKKGPENTPAIAAPPFEFLTYKEGFHAAKPFGQTAQAEIQQRTGILKLTADSQGKYLVGISISEYRNNQKLGTTQRIFFTEIN